VKQLDRYVLRQLIGPFLFFMMIFGGILWLNQAVRILDVIVRNGHSGAIFAELSLFLLPKLMETVVPVAAFSAAVFLTNRMYSEAELLVFMGVGHGPANITTAFLAFGGICFVIMLTLTHWATPMALGKFQDRQYEMNREYLTQLLKAGEFVSPEAGVTVFFGQVSPNGAISDVIINDRREPSAVVTHTANEGQIIREANAPKLVLKKGSIQQFFPKTRTLSIIQFDGLNYDLSQFSNDIEERTTLIAETFSWNLPSLPSVSAAQEIHSRTVKALLAFVVPSLGAIVLLSAGYSRSGFFLRITLGIGFMLGANAVRGFVEGFVENGTAGWPILYTPVVLAFMVILVMLRLGQAPWKSGLLGLLCPNGIRK
jgi:lipopolysaccharide export system permease protein